VLSAGRNKFIIIISSNDPASPLLMPLPSVGNVRYQTELVVIKIHFHTLYPITTMVTATFYHPLIGRVKYNAKCDSVKKFLGLQYATLNDRFAPPRLREYPQGGIIDASSHGQVVSKGCLHQLADCLDRPSVLAHPDGADHEFKLVQHSLPYDRDAQKMSDVDGLVLNIYVPASDGASVSTALPVFAFVHGGGFNGGSSSFPTNNMTNLVRLSMSKEMPVIGVSLK
jgi:hypothetical protein